jgi:hypothetical protein
MASDHGDPVELQPSDLVGTWQSGQRRTIVSPEDGTLCPLTCRSRCSMSSYQVISIRQDRLDGSGTWKLKAPAKVLQSIAVSSLPATPRPRRGQGLRW